ERTGSHVPHPGILERRTASYEVLDERELPIRVDGRLIGAATHFELRCLPDALVIVVCRRDRDRYPREDARVVPGRVPRSIPVG
ncbi:MAG TPA: hypothetical protein PKA87_16300, partial [Microthrixaceae bacterium]|nr:hypothetical protein [Microthrixaceae bacterium]